MSDLTFYHIYFKYANEAAILDLRVLPFFVNSDMQEVASKMNSLLQVTSENLYFYSV